MEVKRGWKIELNDEEMKGIVQGLERTDKEGQLYYKLFELYLEIKKYEPFIPNKEKLPQP